MLTLAGTVVNIFSWMRQPWVGVHPVLETSSAEGYDLAMNQSDQMAQRVLWTGDALAYFIITLLGFSSHGTLGSSAIMRILATLLPFYVCWLLFAAWAGVNRASGQGARIWLLRSGVTAVLAAPMAATIRAMWLGAPVLPIFVVVMAGVSALGIMIWRAIYHFGISAKLRH